MTPDDTIDLGDGPPIHLPTLLETRLLVQGASGSGKTHLLRRLLEATATRVQQVVVDPEGELTYLCDLAGHAYVDAAAGGLAALALRVRAERRSVVLDLSALLDPAAQVHAVAEWVAALFAAPRELWHPALVAVDEVHLFAPQGAGTERCAVPALRNLMCRGRKRGLAGLIATQRLSKVDKDVAAEANNVLAGRTLIDLDVRRAAANVGLPPKEAGRLRALAKGEFLGLGPALASATARYRVGAVATDVPATTREVLASSAAAPVAAPVAASLPAVLGGVLAACDAAARAGQPRPSSAALARRVPGVANPAHAAALVAALVLRGRLASAA